MEKRFQEIYIYLHSLAKLEKKQYDDLIELYGNSLVDSVIEYMIGEDEKNIHKFDYYVSICVSSFDNFVDKSIFDMYLDDLGSVRMLNHDENKYYIGQVYNVILELREIFSNFDCKYTRSRNGLFNSIVDEIEFYLKHCEDVNLLNRIKELYERFIFLRNKLVDGNIRVVVAAAKTYYKDDASFIEIVQYGNIGLMKAIEKFNPKFDTAFSTYAYYWVKCFFRGASKFDSNSSYSISYDLIEKNQIRLRTIDLLNYELGRNPTMEEVAEKMGISVRKLGEIENAHQLGLSLFSRVSLIDDNDCLFLEICEDSSVNVEEEVIYKDFLPFLMKCMDKCLSEREKFILINRYGICDNPLGIDELKNNINICRQRIEQIKKRSLVKLRESYGDKLKDYLK